MTKTYFCKYQSLFAFVLILTFISPQVSALGLSTYRIYLDDEHSQQNFIVYNRDDFSMNCRIDKRHFVYDEIGKFSEYNGDKKPVIAADKFMRYSPRTFRLEPGSVQSVSFKLRRKSKQIPKEYRTYISVDCDAEPGGKNQNLKGNVHLEPKLRHNVPVVVRTGKLDAKLYFNDVVIKKNAITFAFNKSGDRSTYGEFVLVDKSTGKVIAKQPSVSVPLEVKVMRSSLAFKDVDIDDLSLSFIEDTKLSGKQVIEYPLSSS